MDADIILLNDGNLVVNNPSRVTQLSKSFYGRSEGRVVFLSLVEALYLMDVRGWTCVDERGKEVPFDELALKGGSRILTKYHCFKDWRDRGLIVRPAGVKGRYNRSPVKEYPSVLPDYDYPSFSATYFFDDGYGVVTDDDAKILYFDSWFGQYATYKIPERGRYLKLDPFEVIFLANRGVIRLKNTTWNKIMAFCKKRDSFFEDIYNVYEDWRLRGYVVKTGFKFGTHFRIYFPGASPSKDPRRWVHSKHVLHVFPRRKTLLTSEFSRAIRVAHSVRKTFILAIPGQGRPSRVPPDYLLYHRKKGGVETPKSGLPKYAMLSLNEDEPITGDLLAGAIEDAVRRELDLMLGISDRETSVTYYSIHRINLPGSTYDYYEVEWVQP
ncbi:MAG: tRNA-intron lyase [Candidatus Asgardarchaeia archaeon]